MAGCSAAVEIDLSGNPLGNAGAADVAADAGPAVEVLDLTNTGMGDAGATALAGSPRLAGVQALYLANNPIGPRGREALVDRFGDAVSFELHVQRTLYKERSRVIFRELVRRKCSPSSPAVESGGSSEPG